MKVAIVGTSSNLTENEERDVRQFVSMILKDYDPLTTTIISGGAKGVDSLAQEIALLQHFAVKPIFPIGIGTKANLARNSEIATECDDLFCITIPYYKDCDRKQCYHHKPLGDHQKTAGCYTMNKALEMNKKCRLLVTPKRIEEVKNE